MIQYCVVLPLRTGEAKRVLGDRVFHCKVNNNKVDILDDNSERKIHEINLEDVKIIPFNDIQFKNDATMWLK